MAVILCSSQSSAMVAIPVELSAGGIPANRFIGFDGALCVDEAKAIGVSLQAGTLGNTISVQVSGRARVETGEAIAVGEQVFSDNQGRAMRLTSEQTVNGIAMTESTGEGDFIDILVNTLGD